MRPEVRLGDENEQAKIPIIRLSTNPRSLLPFWPPRRPLHTHTHTLSHTLSHINTHTHYHTHPHTHTHTRALTHSLTHIHTHTLTHTHTHTHTGNYTKGPFLVISMCVCIACPNRFSESQVYESFG